MIIKSIVTIVFVAAIVAAHQQEFSDADVVTRSSRNPLNIAKDFLNTQGNLLSDLGYKKELVLFRSLTIEELLEKCKDQENQRKMVYVGGSKRQDASDRYNEHKNEDRFHGTFYWAPVEPGIVSPFHPCYFNGAQPVVSVVKLCENYLLSKCPGPKQNNKQSNLSHLTTKGSVYMIVGSN